MVIAAWSWSAFFVQQERFGARRRANDDLEIAR
jgi:hypothetical protein